jgi:hypothetical protein
MLQKKKRSRNVDTEWKEKNKRVRHKKILTTEIFIRDLFIYY